MSRALFLFLVPVATFLACGAFDAGDETPTNTVDGGGGNEGGSTVGTEGGARKDADTHDDASAETSFSEEVKKIPGLVAYWHLDEGGSGPPVDVVGGNQGVYQPTVTPTAGLLPGDGPASATSFATGALSISGGDLSSLRTFDRALTVGALVRVASFKSQQNVVFKNGSFVFGVLGDTTVFLDVQRGGSLARFTSVNKVSAEVPAFIVGAFDLGGGGSVSLWVNGKVASVSGQTSLTVGAAANKQTLCIGGSTATDGTDCRSSSVGFAGTIDEVFLANQAVSPALVAKLTQLAGF